MVRSNIFLVFICFSFAMYSAQVPEAEDPVTVTAQEKTEVFHNSGTGMCRTVFADGSYFDKARPGCKECEQKQKKD